MKKNIVIIIMICLLVVIGVVCWSQKTFGYQDETKLHEVLDVGKDIYVQHDENGKDVYLLHYEGNETVVYKNIKVNYTASKQWTSDGLYIDDLTGKIGATSPDDYIEVSENEEYFVRLYGIGDVYRGLNGDEWHITAPIVFFDDDNNCVGSALSGTFSSSKEGVLVTVPALATKMYISNYNNQNISIQKKLTLTSDEFNKIKANQEKNLEYVLSNYEDIENDPIVYKELDKGYITFVNDDSRPSVDKFADLFISKEVPLCYAAVADNLLNNASNLAETRLDVMLRVQNAGGEILAHNASVITEDTIGNEEFMYNYFVVQKQLLKRLGLNVNGIILAGGKGQITGSLTTAKWTSAFYKYSDLLGEKYSASVGEGSVYFHSRVNLGNYGNDISKIKEVIDDAIKNKKWVVFYFHDENEVQMNTLSEVLDYINSVDDRLDVVTYNTMYERFATRESTVINDKKTYYVASDGISDDGTDINNPISLETLNNKNIKSGDTILFKRGDVFFGTLNLDKVVSVDDEKVIISSFGSGDLPTISTYKYIIHSWEKYTENIYRINLRDINNYVGYMSDDLNSFNVGFLEDDNGNKYYSKKKNIEYLKDEYDFYSVDGYIYMYLDCDPYVRLGNLKAVVRSNLMTLSSNMEISNIRFAYTGGHAIEGSNENEANITIYNCIIENIGGSYLYSSSLSSDTRYGNGIEFYGSNAQNIEIKNNIFRNIYDVAFTIQGIKGSGNSVYVHDNVFVGNSQDSEIWESGAAKGVYDYQFYNNLSINQGRGWGYEARVDKYAAASILFWGYEIDNTNIEFSHNTFYNPRQIYYLSVATNQYFLTHDTIRMDNNRFYMGNDTTIYRNNWDYESRFDFISNYQVDINSEFSLIDDNDYITNQALNLNDINKLRLLILANEEVIKDIEFLNVPSILTIKKGEILNFDNIYLNVNYLDGMCEKLSIDSSMVSEIDYELERQMVSLSYLGYMKSFELVIVDEIKDNVNDDNENDLNDDLLESDNEELDSSINDESYESGYESDGNINYSGQDGADNGKNDNVSSNDEENNFNEKDEIYESNENNDEDKSDDSFFATYGILLLLITVIIFGLLKNKFNE